MHINLKKKYLYFYNYKIKCSIGKNGLTNNKCEGDQKTPKGKFKFTILFYRKDRVPNFQCKIKSKSIKKNMGWCDDPVSKHYNKLIYFPFKYSAEKLYIKENIYDFILVLNYNTRPVKKGAGSAIFLHLTEKKFKATKGCIGIRKKDFLNVLKKVSKKTNLIIN
tara:strand:- start:318 stop:809 length:492 start_codon:yes stop_codon:yes gene_type:complete